MHGRIRRETEKTIEEIEEDHQKAIKYKQLEKMCFAFKNAKDYSITALKASQKLLFLNPDVISIWNYRKEYINNSLLLLKSDNEKCNQLIESELEFTQNIIQNKDTKCYPLWHHRKWLFTLSPELLTINEIKLCEQLLQIDERNFHCWNYWKYICTLLKLTSKDLLDFTYKRIQHNFSNYSAWNYRITIIIDSYEKHTLPMDIKECISNELELILNALYTEPDDQSAWYYQKSLFDFIQYKSIYEQQDFEILVNTRKHDIEELLELEPDCTLAIHGLDYLNTLL